MHRRPPPAERHEQLRDVAAGRQGERLGESGLVDSGGRHTLAVYRDHRVDSVVPYRDLLLDPVLRNVVDEVVGQADRVDADGSASHAGEAPPVAEFGATRRPGIRRGDRAEIDDVE